jgi:hypothetical protein
MTDRMRFVSERPVWRGGDSLRSIIEVVRVLGQTVLDRVDTRYADRLNPTELEEFPRYAPTVVERPRQTEEELDGRAD